MKDMPTKISETEQYIKNALLELSEAKRIDYHRRVSLAQTAYNDYKHAEIYRQVYENSAKRVNDLYFLKFILFGSIVALLIDWYFFSFLGWSIGVVILLIPICFGTTKILMNLEDSQAFMVSYWVHEKTKASSLAIHSGAGMYEINKIYRIEEEFKSENIKEINTEEDAVNFSGEKEDAIQLQWNKIYIRILNVIQSQ
jgi:hypothetical protein